MPAEDPANDATAQTLNYALGNLGGRQKSWMQAANPSAHLTPSELTANLLPFTVRKRGRPRKQLVTQPPATDAPRPTIEPQTEAQPPSNSTSPQLANVVTRQNNGNHVASLITVFPSPTPSEENTDNAPAPALRGGDAMATLDFLELNAEQAAYAPDTPLETIFMDDARRAASGSKRPSEDAGAQASKRVQQQRPAALAGATEQPQSAHTRPAYPNVARRPSAPQGHVGSPHLQQTNSRSPSLGQGSNAQMPSPHLRQGMHANSISMTPPQGQAPFGPPRTSSRGTGPSPYNVPPTNPHHLGSPLLQAPQFADLQPTWYTQEECIQVLTTFQASFAVSPHHQRDGRRINVLQDATERQDWPFLFMHQLYCLLDFNPNLVPADLRNTPGLKKAMHIMHDVLDSNKKLSPAVLHLFSHYPHHLEVIRTKWPAGFEHQAQKFLSFVASSAKYAALKLTCERRRFPPVAWELPHYLGLESTTFQRLLFTAILRCIWRGVPQTNLQSQYEAQAVNYFQQNQITFYERTQPRDGQYPDISQTVQGNQEDLRHWGALLKQLVEEFEAILRSQGYSIASPHIPVSPYAQQQAVQHQQHPIQIQQSPQLAAIEAEMQSRARRQVQPHSAQAAIQQTRGRGRPRREPVPASHVLPSQLRAQQQQQHYQQQHQQIQQQRHLQQQQQLQQQQPLQQRQQLQRPPVPLLPPSGWVQPQQRQPAPARFGLHQAHLRSPVLQAQSPKSPLYHFVQGYIRPPTRLSNAGVAIEKWTFNLDADTMKCIPTAAPTVPGGPDCRAVTTQSKTVRVRCAKWAAADLPNEHVWAITDTSWIPYSYFTFNGTSLQQRKKVHHGKDLPIDITPLLKEGENVLDMTVMAQSNDTSYQNYLVAIEILGVISHASVKQYCLEKLRIPAQEVLSNIRNKLSGSSEDDEIAIVESNLTINLFDPFSRSKICDTPVRSKVCLHNDCFDLDTFLETRTRKGDASVPDLWRCPICSADARPHHLLVDGFLEEVKQVLDAQGRSKTRAIIIHQDGTWKPKAEMRDPNGVSDRGTSDEPPTPVVARASIPAQAEIIDLSD